MVILVVNTYYSLIGEIVRLICPEILLTIVWRSSVNSYFVHALSFWHISTLCPVGNLRRFRDQL